LIVLDLLRAGLRKFLLPYNCGINFLNRVLTINRFISLVIQNGL